jgi:hypothetical protein
MVQSKPLYDVAPVVRSLSTVTFRKPRIVIRRVSRPGNMRALRARMLIRGWQATKASAEVLFEVHRNRDGCTAIALRLTHPDGSAASDRVFTLELVPDLRPEVVSTLVGALNQCVRHLSMAVQDAEGKKEKPDDS